MELEKFIPGISDIIHFFSKFFSNNITTISPPVGDDKPEESRRYTFFYTIFEIALFDENLCAIAHLGALATLPSLF